MNLFTSIALALLGGIFAALAAFGGIRAAWRGLGRRRGAFAALAAFAVIATICAQKPNPPVITVDAFLRDAGSYATNDVLHVAVTNAPAYATVDFSSCPVLVYARPRGLSDAPEWEELLPRRTFSELPADYAIEDATNYNYLVYLDYVPPSPVHTNGVFELRGFVVPGDEPGNLEQLTAGFINSRAITIRGLPYDEEVEYLESTGTQYILLPAAYKRWDIGLKPKDIAKPAYLRFYAGCMNRGSRTASCYATSDSALEFQNYNRAVLTVPCDFYTWHDISVRSSTVTVDGAVFTFSIGTAAYGSYIFGCDYNGVVGVKCQISYYRAYDENGNVVLDLIPVRFTNENNQSEGAMFDRANPTVGLNSNGSPRTDGLYRNRGTGNFGYGNDK